ncbi:MAG: hypothetical protein CM1200mP16_11160 [Nitrospina sp.]|nr:MAG: hypothetical protein CM1200mP16_11160 [Nitrospina sp.]
MRRTLKGEVILRITFIILLPLPLLLLLHHHQITFFGRGSSNPASRFFFYCFTAVSSTKVQPLRFSRLSSSSGSLCTAVSACVGSGVGNLGIDPGLLLN